MGFLKGLAAVAAGVGAVVAAPIVLPAAAAVGAGALATAGATAAAAGATAAAAGTAVTAAVGGAAAAAGTAIAGSAVGGTAIGAATAVGGAVGSAAGALGVGSVATIAGTEAGAAAVGAITSAGVVGAASAVSGAGKMKEASEIKDKALQKYDNKRKVFDTEEDNTNKIMAELGKLKLNVWDSFGRYIDAFKKIKNIQMEGELKLDGELSFEKNELEDMKILALTAKDVLKGGTTSVTVGTLAGIASSAGITSLATASTGTAISTLSGAAATNASLAALGGGAKAVGGLGMAAGTAVTTALMIAPAIAVGGLFLNSKGRQNLDNATEFEQECDQLIEQMDEAQKELVKLQGLTENMVKAVNPLYERFIEMTEWLENLVKKETDFNAYSPGE